MALEKIDGISAAYVNNGIRLHLTDKDGYDQEKIAAALKPFKLTIKEAKPVDGSPFDQKEEKRQPKTNNNLRDNQSSAVAPPPRVGRFFI